MAWEIVIPENEIKRLRVYVGMSQEEFSKYLGVPKRTIEDWETGKRKIKPYVLKAIIGRCKYDALRDSFKEIEEF